MTVEDEFFVDYDNRKIFHNSNETGIFSVRTFYSYWMDLFDELPQMDDPPPMTAQTPTEFTFVNGWFMPYDGFKYLSGGAVQTNGWDGSTDASGVRILSLDSAGYVNFTDADTGQYVTGETTNHSGVLLAYDNDLRKIWLRIIDIGNTFDQAEDIGVPGGNGSGTTLGASVAGENLWPNIYTLGTITGGTNLYLIQDGEIIDPWWGTGHVDLLIKTKEADTEIDNGVLTIFDRKWGALYDHYEIDLTVGGRNAVPLATSNDVNNTGVEGTVSGYTDIVFTFGPTNKDLGNGDGSQPYDVSIDLAGRPVYDFYEYTKFACRSGSEKELSGLSGDRYRSLKGGAYGESKQAPFGTFAGGKFFGAQGVWIENYDNNDSQNFQLIDSDGDIQVPPNTVTIEVTDLISGDRVTCYKLLGAGQAINKQEYYAQTGNDSGDQAVYVKGTISGDTPSAGWVSIDGDVYDYDSWETGEFYVPDGLTQAYAEDSWVYVPIIYTGAWQDGNVSNTLVYSAGHSILFRVRKKGIVPFQQESTIGTNGRSIAAIRQTDTIVT